MTLDEAPRVTTRAAGLAARRAGLAVAMVDAGGHLVILHRMDECRSSLPRSPGARPGPPSLGERPPQSRGPRPPGSLCSPPPSSWPAAAATRPSPGDPLRLSATLCRISRLSLSGDRGQPFMASAWRPGCERGCAAPSRALLLSEAVR